MGATSTRPDRIDVEGGPISARDFKAAREVTEEVLSEADQLRLSNLIVDMARDDDSTRTRAARDRDRATPRDSSHAPSTRLHRSLPGDISYRGRLSARQRKVRSALKNRVMAAAPQSQHRAVHALLGSPDPTDWQRVNTELHRAAGDVHALDDPDRVMVQRLDRAIQSYERGNDRTHVVYVAVRLPPRTPSVFDERDLPAGLRVGTRIAFDQFTPAAHNLHELPGHDDQQVVILEIATTRGMYMGRSGSGDDTSHILPRGMHLRLSSAAVVPYDIPGDFGERLVVQARDLFDDADRKE
ncbi:hypothetical protein C0J29_31650 (plasmid) [Mycobacterium paragordonae]|uniref:Uncharacterized protein n=1 Tax=Mycobacterium paragordonae TaxID=1389713 RepID=A0ABQ1CFR3_9MYCO|nr:MULTISPECIES: hypothetical protein [Mycobacterium]AYE99641.1 hypothetical protein C0J29_31650 [Mycobacterium paragordonae]QNI09783.1 hypothetical protein GAN17_25675 [Mycobacterium kubicae]GFG83269.1 hypothetical protein MPRG_65450 [Mycobacterium paragordonae]